MHRKYGKVWCGKRSTLEEILVLDCLTLNPLSDNGTSNNERHRFHQPVTQTPSPRTAYHRTKKAGRSMSRNLSGQASPTPNLQVSPTLVRQAELGYHQN